MHKSIYLHDLAYALGDDTRPLETSVAQGLTLSSEAVLTDAGFGKHHICRPDTSAYDLAKASVAELSATKLADTRGILYATCLPCNGNVGNTACFQETRDVKHLMDFPASHLQADFNLHTASVIGLNQQACTGMLGSLRLAKALLTTEPELKQLLCLTADRFPPGALYEQAYNLISDGAAACLVSTEARGFEIITCYAKTNGAMAQASDDETVGTFFNNTHQVLQATLAQAGLTMADIDWIVPQNTHAKAWQILARLLSFDFQKVYFPLMADVGHVISGDNLINLKHLDESGQIQSGEYLLLLMAGFGLNWQCVILRKV